MAAYMNYTNKEMQAIAIARFIKDGQIVSRSLSGMKEEV